MSFSKAVFTLLAGVLATNVAMAVPASVAQPATPKRFPVHLVSSVANTSEVTLRYYTPRPREQFCVAFAGVRVDLGPGWKHMPQCLTSDQYGAATVYLSARGRGTLIVSIVLPEGETHSDTLQLGEMRDKASREGL